MTLIAEFKGSADYRQLAPSTSRAYTAYIKLIEDEFGDLPLAALERPPSAWRVQDLAYRFAKRPVRLTMPGQPWRALCRSARIAGMIATNPCEKGGRLYTADRADKVWRRPRYRRSRVSIAGDEAGDGDGLWTGQRQGDLLRLPWSAYDGSHIRLRQSKTGRRVVMPAGQPLRTLMARTEPPTSFWLTGRSARTHGPDDDSGVNRGPRTGSGRRGRRPAPSAGIDRPDVPRSARLGRRAVGACRSHGAADRDLHRP